MNLRVVTVVFCCWNLVVGLPKIDNLSEDNLVAYQYRYSVDELQHRGPLMDRWEQRLGEYVKGAYSVMQPDGRIRTVDYEVDGNKGYHAVIRMNQPGPELLSIQQFTQASEIFPEAVLPTTANEFRQPAASTQNDRILNYHASTPYHNTFTTSKLDHKASANTQFTDRVLPTTDHIKLPPSPANYNVAHPQTTNLIYFRTPAATIFHKGHDTSKVQRSPTQQLTSQESIKVQRSLTHQLAESAITEVILPTARSRRNSKLVKRFKSFADINWS